MEERFYIDILNGYKDNFRSHLNQEDNHRTIFSGIFGIGKTTFLKEFFELSDIKENYEIIHLYPVNYSIASNEDIFELIKFDIFYRLLSKNIEFDVNSISMDITAYQFILDNFSDIIFPFLNFIPEVGGSIKEIAEKCLELKSKFKIYHEGLQSNELSDLNNFLKDFTKKKGTIYENDFYTELIINLINKLKSNGRKVVLIVDDIDRIDPDHIFRLLNIFSAHTDIQGSQNNYNKFDFDKVVFVCDTENIRNIYKAKFGVDTDFNGYIDKFYSKSIFQFRVSDILINSKRYITKHFKFSGNIHGGGALQYDNLFSENFLFILEHLFLNNKITLRDLAKICSKTVDFPTYNLKKIGFSKYHNTSFKAIQLYDIFLEINSGDKSKLHTAFSDIKQFIKIDDKLEFYLAEIALVKFLINQGNQFDLSSSSLNIKIEIEGVECEIKYTGVHDKELICRVLNYNDLKNKFNYFQHLHELFTVLSNRN